MDVDGGVLHVRNSSDTTIGKTYLYCDNLELGLDRTADGLTQIDFWASSSTINWDAKIIRNSGANGTFELWNKGTGDMVFNVNSNPKMYIKNSGNVGIGNVNPTAKLHVSSADGYIQKWDSTSSNSFLYHDSTSTQIGTNTATDMILSAYGKQMILKQGTGNVGIGTNNPARQKHVYRFIVN